MRPERRRLGRRWVPMALGLLLAGPLALAQPKGDSWLLDDFTKTYPANEVYGAWQANKYAPLFGSGERYFFQFVHTSAEHYFVLKSGKDNSFSIGVKTGFQVKDWSVMAWEWRMMQLPTGGDVRVRERDDQAGSVCVIVDPGLTSFDSALCYLFENDGPKDIPITSPQKDNVRYLILRTAKAGDALGQWYREERNLLADYKRLFGRDPAKSAVIGFQIDSNDTKSAGEAHYRSVILRKS